MRNEKLEPLTMEEQRNFLGNELSNFEFTKYSPELVEVIDELALKGFVYNSMVEEEATKRYGFTGKHLQYLVYNTQEFVGRRNAQKFQKEQEIKLSEMGFTPITQEQIDALVGTRKFIELARSVNEIKRVKLIKDAKNMVFFVEPKVRKYGYIVKVGDFVKI